ncbi:MAG: hypothetical protein LBU25_10825 [Treponema sp.]|jgi:hypothetical protein|nr:hypothetical protein [Treponema sp.]
MIMRKMKPVWAGFLLCIGTVLGFSQEAKKVSTLDSAIAATLQRLNTVLTRENRECGIAVTFFTAETEALSKHVIDSLQYGLREIRLSNKGIAITELDSADWKRFEALAGGNADLEGEIGAIIQDNEIDYVISGSLIKKGPTHYTYTIEAKDYIDGEWLIAPYTTDIGIDATLAGLLGPTFMDETWKYKILYVQLHFGYGTGYALGGKFNGQVIANSTFGLSLGLGVDYEGFTEGIHLGGDEAYTKRFVVVSAFPTLSYRPNNNVFEFYLGPFKNMDDVMNDGIASKAWGLLGGVQIGGYIHALRGSIAGYVHSGIYFKDASKGVDRITLSVGAAYKIGLITRRD